MEEFNESVLTYTKVIVAFERSEAIARVGAMRGKKRHRSPLHHMRPGICRTSFTTPTGQRIFFESLGCYDNGRLVIEHIIRPSGHSTNVTRDRKWALELLKMFGGYTGKSNPLPAPSSYL